MEQEHISLTEAGKRFGLTPFGAGQWVRGYYAFKQAREASDYIREVDERAYPYFQELFSRSSAAVREWMQWNEDESKFDSTQILNEFVGWLYPCPTEDEGSEVRGTFDKQRLRTRDDVRLVAHLLKSSEPFFQQFRNGHDLGATYTMATAEVTSKNRRSHGSSS